MLMLDPGSEVKAIQKILHYQLLCLPQSLLNSHILSLIKCEELHQQSVKILVFIKVDLL